MECTALSRREDTPQHIRAKFIQGFFARDLVHRVRLWKWGRKPEIR